MKKSIEILKVRIDQLSKIEVLRQISLDFDKPLRSQVVTINSEFIVLAQDNPDFQSAINKAKFRLADGFGVLVAAKFLSLKLTNNSFLRPISAWAQLKYCLLAALFSPKYLKQPIPERIAGVDLIIDIVKMAEGKQLKVFLLGGGPGVVEQTALKLQTDFNELKISGIYCGSPKIEEEEKIIELIKKNKSDILFVAFGAPAQDLWINRNLRKTKCKLAIGVGGTFDFIAGKIPRAPLWMQNHGLEWLYRLVREPRKRFRRQLSLIKFLWLVYRSKLKAN